MILSVIMLSMLVASAHYGQISSAPARSGLNADGKPYSRLAEAVAIMHCLTKVELNWLGESLPAVEKTNTFRVGLRHDKNTYPGEDVIIVVVLESATRGDVFELRGERRQQGREYNLENNGSFKLRHKQFTWPNEIFGGIWTHEYIEKNITRIMRGPKVWVRLKTAQKPMPGVTCTWYGSQP